jgi:hypothetical protein
MSIHAEIVETIRAVITENGDVDILSPTFIALQVIKRFGQPDKAHIYHLSLEQAKQMARVELRAKFEPDGERNDTHQGDMFSGLLQERYPVPTRRGEDPQYKYLRLLTVEELDWNIAKLERSADARVQHARALRAHRDRVAVAAA